MAQGGFHPLTLDESRYHFQIIRVRFEWTDGRTSAGVANAEGAHPVNPLAGLHNAVIIRVDASAKAGGAMETGMGAVGVIQHRSRACRGGEASTVRAAERADG